MSAKKSHRSRLATVLLAGLLAPALSGCGEPTSDSRVLVIGLDGATFAQLDPLFEQGLLPNLAALRDRGTHGELETILPPISPPAWTSATTGVNPGKHNIFDFFHMSKTGPQALLTSALDRRARPVWQFLNEDGYRTGMMNIPMTFPPDRVDGFFISGFPYGNATTGFTYPPELEAELGDYPRDLFGESLQPGHEGQLLAQFRKTADVHASTAKRLLQQEDWDLFWVVFTGTDKVQHFYWKYSDPDHPLYDAVGAARFGEVIREMYERLDRAVGELVEAAGPETDVIVMSDHGFGPIYQELRLVSWLRDESFLAPPESGDAIGRVDAFPPGPFSGLLRVSEKGRDFQGQVAPGDDAEAVKTRLVDALGKLKDPESGQPFVENVYRGEDVYSGPYAANGPDVVFVESPTFFVGRGGVADPAFGLPSYTFSGFHRPQGILFAAGPHFARSEERRRFSILDVAPTLYWLFNTDAPSDLDGEVPAALVGADSLRARPLRVGERTAVILPEDLPLTDAEREVLQSLGYVQ